VIDDEALMAYLRNSRELMEMRRRAPQTPDILNEIRKTQNQMQIDMGRMNESVMRQLRVIRILSYY
jgi:hypothetical protein